MICRSGSTTASARPVGGSHREDRLVVADGRAVDAAIATAQVKFVADPLIRNPPSFNPAHVGLSFSVRQIAFEISYLLDSNPSMWATWMSLVSFVERTRGWRKAI